MTTPEAFPHDGRDDTSPTFSVRYARADQHPSHWGTEQLVQAARDSVIHYAGHHGLRFKWVHDQVGEMWCDGRPTGVKAARSEARIVGVDE